MMGVPRNHSEERMGKVMLGFPKFLIITTTPSKEKKKNICLTNTNYPLVNYHSWLEYPPFLMGNTSFLNPGPPFSNQLC